MLLPLLKAEATQFSGCEFLPVTAVATPVAGRVKIPRMVPVPTTSSPVAGAAVLMPILAVGDTPVWNTAELPIVAAPVKSNSPNSLASSAPRRTRGSSSSP